MTETERPIGQIAAALAKAQGELGAVTKDHTAKVETRTGGSYTYTYADLASVIEAIRPVFAKHGLCYFQAPAAEGPHVTVTTTLAHESGEYFTSTLTITAKDDSPQAVGSAITYARRYGLQAAAGLAPEDDDGQAAQGDGRPALKKAKTITPTQARVLTDLAQEHDCVDNLKAYLARKRWAKTTDIWTSEYVGIVEKVKAGTLAPPEPPADFSSAKEIGDTVFGTK